MNKMLVNWYTIAELKEQYKKKLVSADEALKVVKSGDQIHYGLFAGVIFDLDKALAKRLPELHDLNICATMWCHPNPPEVVQADPAARCVRYNSTHLSGMERRMNMAGNCWPIPVQFRENPKAYSENRDGGIDVMMLQVCPMDAFGNFNMGLSVAEYNGLLRVAKTVIVEVNPKMPVIMGTRNYINLAQVDYVVEGSASPIPTISGNIAATEVEQKIARHVVGLIESGSTLQLGIGGLPDYLGRLIADSDITDLSVHTEMFVDAYMHLYEAGKITNSSPANRGKMLFTFCMGSERLYEWVNRNQMMEIAPVDHVNDIAAIAQHDKMISINSCLQIDLFGQVNSESIELRHIAGTGGQVDYVLGAFKSNGGKSFLCTPSTKINKAGQREPTIMPTLPPGSIITTPRTAVHYFVTEYGAVNLKGKSTWEKAELIISVAHPDYREELTRAAEKMGIWKTSSKFS